MSYTNQLMWRAAEAERAFGKELGARRRAVWLHRLPRRCVRCLQLTILEPSDLRRSSAAESVQEIALDAIVGTLEPHRARQFDHEFRPHPITRARWLSVWLAEQDGVVLPPISVASFAHGYAIRDRHHRVSVARARGALTITAIVS